MICQELEHRKVGKLVNVNTDGFYYLIDSKEKLNEFEKIMKDFELKTGITFSYNIIDSGIFAQKDVNNYIIYDKKNNKIKTKGGMVNRYNTDRI
ncbi:MAG: hypothetical protein MJ224_00030 [archaeon]|nr:hypothetical protein [archaeon]